MLLVYLGQHFLSRSIDFVRTYSTCWEPGEGLDNPADNHSTLPDHMEPLRPVVAGGGGAEVLIFRFLPTRIAIKQSVHFEHVHSILAPANGMYATRNLFSLRACACFSLHQSRSYMHANIAPMYKDSSLHTKIL